MAYKRHLAFKIFLLETFGTQRRAARRLKMREDALSRIVSGRENPSTENERQFKKLFGEQKVKELFPQ